MLFHEVAPLREECTAQISTALQAEGGRIYLDANVLIHCLEMSAGASADLLQAFGRYSDRVGIPVWAANETWEHLRERVQRKPLQKLVGSVDKVFKAVSSETARYVDDDAINDMTRDEFRTELTGALEAVTALIGRVRHHEPSIDDTTSRLLPFMEAQRLDSNLPEIVETARRTAEFRSLHRIPPGFADAAQSREDSHVGTSKKGKSKNPNGDLIIWLEILDDCKQNNATHLVLVTRDVNKGDWVYKPDKVRDGNGRPQLNSTGLTLALPLLVHEAKKICPSLESVQIITVEMLAQIWTQQRIDVSQLAAALQAEENSSLVGQSSENFVASEDVQDVEYVPAFRSSDMEFEPDPERPFDIEIGKLRAEGWKAQNEAVRDLEPRLHTFDREQRIQVGRGLVAAANLGAVEPAEVLARVLANEHASASVRSDVLIGALAEVYIANTGEPKKPVAKFNVTKALFEVGASRDLAPAFETVLLRLKAIRSEFLALPNDLRRNINAEVVLDKNELVNLMVGNVELLEEDAPKNRTLQSTGRDIEMSIGELFELVSEEFIVPDTWFVYSNQADAKIIVPDHIGFVAWGPRTGTSLR